MGEKEISKYLHLYYYNLCKYAMELMIKDERVDYTTNYIDFIKITIELLLLKSYLKSCSVPDLKY